MLRLCLKMKQSNKSKATSNSDNKFHQTLPCKRDQAQYQTRMASLCTTCSVFRSNTSMVLKRSVQSMHTINSYIWIWNMEPHKREDCHVERNQPGVRDIIEDVTKYIKGMGLTYCLYGKQQGPRR